MVARHNLGIKGEVAGSHLTHMAKHSYCENFP